MTRYDQGRSLASYLLTNGGVAPMQTSTAAEALTRHFALVVNNEEGLYNWRRELVREAMRDEYPRAVLQDSLRDWCDELCQRGEHGLLLDELLGVAVAYIDWYALADRWIEEEAQDA